MLVCAHMHTKECDVREAMGAIGNGLQYVMSMVHDRCDVSDVWKKVNETAEAIRTNSRVPDMDEITDMKTSGIYHVTCI